MTSKERILTAICNRQPDRVPACPDISTMIPCRLTKKPFWDIELYESPPLWKAYIEAVKYFGIDGWFFYAYLDFKTDSKVEVKRQVISRSEEKIVEKIVYVTPAGELPKEITYYRDNPSWRTVKQLKDIVRDFKKLRYLYPKILGYEKKEFEAMRAALGDLGVFGPTIIYPGFQWWNEFVNGGLESLVYAYYDHPDLIEEWRQMEDKQCVRMMDMILDARPDYVLLGGSGSITMQSPELFRELSLPTIKKLIKMAKEAGIPTMLHSCGKERALVQMCAEETDLNCVNPLEVPPMGDCDLAEVKRSFGHKLSLMGNLHTTEVMLRGTPEDVEREALKCIEVAAPGGGFILSTGDQCSRDTPDENIFKLVEVCKKYGRYS